MKRLSENFLAFHGFPPCIGSIDCTHIEIQEPRENYTDYIKRKGYPSLNVQALCDYRYCFMDVVIRWPGSVHDARIFLNSSLNEKFRRGIIPRCEKIIVDGEDPIPVCMLGDPAYPLLPFFNEGIR